MNRLAAEVARNPQGATAARDQLRKIFSGWKPLAGQIAALGDTLPLAREGASAAAALGQLADLGNNALNYLASGGTPASWKASAGAALDELAKPKGLLRLAGVDAVRLLLDALP